MALLTWQSRRSNSVETLLRSRAEPCPPPLRVGRKRGLRLTFCLTPPRLLVMGTSSLLVAAFLGISANRASPGLQLLELEGYTRLTGQARRVVQVDLARYQSFTQYSPEILSPAAGNFGGNACGLISAAQAVVVSQNPSLAGTQPGFNTVVTIMSQIRARAVGQDGSPTYQAETGIQPAHLVQALRDSPVGDQYEISARDNWTLGLMYQALQEGRIVIVDVRVRKQTQAPSTTPHTFAHFARVLGLDLDRREIYIENTLDQRDGKAYWTLAFEDFMATWRYPETQATIKPSEDDPSIREENVTNWAMVLTEKE